MAVLQKIILGALLVCVLSAAHADALAPDALIRNTVDDVIGVIKQDKDIRAGDQKKIIALVDAKVLPHFDFGRMTQLAVGKYWRTATPEQKQALTTEFRNMLVRTYTKVFTVYRDQTIEVKPFKMGADDSEATVKTVISKPGSQIIPVDYEMKKGTDGWKVFDITIEGVSMVMSYRGTFASEIQENGIDGLIKLLSDKNTSSSEMVKAGAK
ncbi:MAG: ABC transporter substrate-binding protein [Nitrosomonadales bacterium]|nr:ABC transporter substrate-binding protein [Nitrosomonadales bacterium]